MVSTQNEIKELVDDLKWGHPETRKKAAVKLGRIRDISVIPHLINAMKTDEYVYTRVSAIQSLLWIADHSIIEALISVALNDKEKLVKLTAIEGLGSMKNKDALMALNAIYNSETNPEIREATKKAIDNISK